MGKSMKTEMQAKVLQYFVGKLPREEVVGMFKELVDTGEIWNLPTDFLDTAATLWDAGYIGPARALRGANS